MDFHQYAFTRQLEPHQAAALDQHAQVCAIAKGHYMCRQGDKDDVLYLLLAGTVSLEISVPNQGPVQIEHLGAGELLGWSWLTPGSGWMFDIRALTEVKALRIEGSSLRELCERDSRLGYQLCRAYALATAERLNAARMRLLDSFGTHH
ncbi:MAG TPA: cyclic nucleotide-binding domain-containing protein [Bryobacteraceae bacterium]|nr:cyclic nucleotide-binding domain-containing protein [Bryobacteraceae bacterium]